MPVFSQRVFTGKYENCGDTTIAARLQQLEGRRNEHRNEKGFFVSPDGDSSVQGLLGLEAVLFDEAEESVLVHL